MWEKKTGSVGSAVSCSTLPPCPDPQNVNNVYEWSASGTAADGPLFTNFLARINTALSTSKDGSTVADVLPGTVTGGHRTSPSCGRSCFRNIRVARTPASIRSSDRRRRSTGHLLLSPTSRASRGASSSPMAARPPAVRSTASLREGCVVADDRYLNYLMIRMSG